MDSPRITYAGPTNTTPETEISAVANVYKLVIDSARKRGRLPDKSGPDDAKGRIKNDSRAKASIP